MDGPEGAVDERRVPESLPIGELVPLVAVQLKTAGLWRDDYETTSVSGWRKRWIC